METIPDLLFGKSKTKTNLITSIMVIEQNSFNLHHLELLFHKMEDCRKLYMYSDISCALQTLRRLPAGSELGVILIDAEMEEWRIKYFLDQFRSYYSKKFRGTKTVITMEGKLKPKHLDLLKNYADHILEKPFSIQKIQKCLRFLCNCL
jgi:hypothetical protein